MSQASIRDYLPWKRDARNRIVERARDGSAGTATVSANVRVAGASGVRQIRIRDHQLISDSGLDYAGYDLGPTSPELQLGVLGSCLAHTLLIHAAARDVILDGVTVNVFADLDGRGGIDGFDDAPKEPTNLRYAIDITSPAPEDVVADLVAHVEDVCPVLNLLRTPARVRGEFRVTVTDEAT